MPHFDAIQRAFGRHDIGEARAHVGPEAKLASDAMGAQAYTMGSRIALRTPDLFTEAHEAAHIVQQRRGVRLADGVGRPGDRYEQHANAVARAVVRGESAEGLLDRIPEEAGGKSSVSTQMLSLSSEEEKLFVRGAEDWLTTLPLAEAYARQVFEDHYHVHSKSKELEVHNKLNSRVSVEVVHSRVVSGFPGSVIEQSMTFGPLARADGNTLGFFESGSLAYSDVSNAASVAMPVMIRELVGSVGILGPLRLDIGGDLGRELAKAEDYWQVRVTGEGGDVLEVPEAMRNDLRDDQESETVIVRIKPDEEDPNGVNRLVQIETSDEIIWRPLISRSESQRRPVYLIAHHCNQLADIEQSLSSGANAIECDLCYSGGIWYVEHQASTISQSSVKLVDWLVKAKSAASANKNFALLYLDIKTAQDKDGVSLLGSLWSTVNKAELPSALSVLYSMSDFATFDAFKGLKKTDDGEGQESGQKTDEVKLKGNEGVAIDQTGDPKTIAEKFEAEGFKRAWYGTGVTSLLPANVEALPGLPLLPGADVYDKLNAGVKVRDNEEHSFQKVAAWTLASPSSVAKYIIDMKIDAVMVERHKEILKGARKTVDGIWNVRMATQEDDAFQKFG
ncbi:MAG: DUF4157 domain-containing protein [Myxococcota bacterium]